MRVNSQSLSSIGGNSINLLTVCNSSSEYELLKKAFLAFACVSYFQRLSPIANFQLNCSGDWNQCDLPVF